MKKLRATIINEAKAGFSISKNHLIGRICEEHGLATRTAADYIKVLEYNNFIEIEYDIISLKNKQQVLDLEKETDDIISGGEKWKHKKEDLKESKKIRKKSSK